MNIHKAIKKINADAEFTYKNDDVDTIEWLNNTTPISKEDIEAMIPTVETEIEQEKQAAIDKKASGKQKLKDLGLDDDEINALMGA
jgi:transcriptional regulator NrdR family protein